MSWRARFVTQWAPIHAILPPGQSMQTPRGTVHAFSNPFGCVARALIIQVSGHWGPSISRMWLPSSTPAGHRTGSRY